jgi:broad specificity phosphatase PhoE
MPEIVLVRHARSAHVERGWLDVHGVRRWMVAYDAADIVAHDPPPLTLVELTKQSGAVVASDLPRALASAALLAPTVAVESSGLLREAPLETGDRPFPSLGGISLPLRVWGTVFLVRWLWAWWRKLPLPGVDDAVLARAEEAADWLAALAAERGRVVAVTHGTFRTILTVALERRGWRGPDRRPFHTWSAWILSRAD